MFSYTKDDLLFNYLLPLVFEPVSSNQNRSTTTVQVDRLPSQRYLRKQSRTQSSQVRIQVLPFFLSIDIGMVYLWFILASYLLHILTQIILPILQKKNFDKKLCCSSSKHSYLNHQQPVTWAYNQLRLNFCKIFP